MKILALLFLVIGVSAAEAAPGDSAWLAGAISSAKSGAVIDIPAGDYDLTDQKIARSLTLKGAPDGKTVLRSAAVTEKAILVPLPGVDLRAENITFSGAKSWDRNGAGIRHEGRNLTVVNCRFIGNEDGILSTGDKNGVITIERSLFHDNGFGDGQSHAIYVDGAALVDVKDSKFISTRIGHHLKSLSNRTIARGTTFDDGHGRGSYAIDASKGGELIVENNVFIQASDAENWSVVNYDLTRGGSADGLVLRGNKIINRFRGGVFLRNDTKLAPVMAGNAIDDLGGKAMALTNPGSPKPRDN
ncbi:MAG: right-handed parallel beta-helix repeat-containing protein [Parvularculaceae bacterium]|nr:right-handed parallel beta-helix repeat-containing protein [Parvularculaceae bacterium]